MGRCLPEADVLVLLIHPPLPQDSETCLLSFLPVLISSDPLPWLWPLPGLFPQTFLCLSLFLESLFSALLEEAGPFPDPATSYSLFIIACDDTELVSPDAGIIFGCWHWHTILERSLSLLMFLLFSLYKYLISQTRVIIGTSLGRFFAGVREERPYGRDHKF